MRIISSNRSLPKTDVNVNDLHEKMLFMHARGFALLPLKGKQPNSDLLPKDNYGKRSRLLLASRPATKYEIAGWFDEDPEFNSYGVCTGVFLRSENGYLVVFDVDDQSALPEVGAPLPATPTVRTSRGFHFYYIHDEEIRGGSFGAGDLKAKGGYVVGPGSYHRHGSVYEWCDYLAPSEVDFAPLPLWLLEASRATSPLPTVKPSEPSSILTPKIQVPHIKNNLYMPKSFKTLEHMNRDLEIALELMAFCGRPEVERIGQAFLCPLPGHSEQSPSAALWQADRDQPIVLYDFHSSNKAIKNPKRSGRFSWALPDVYASVLTGRTLKLRKGERVVWWLRCLYDLGKVHPPEVGKFELPAHATDAARVLYEGFELLMRLVQLYEPTLKVPFNRRFASKWCLVDENVVRRGMAWLLKRNYIYVAEHGRPYNHDDGVKITLYSFGSGEQT